VLRDRNFWPYFTGNLLSNCGTWFQNLAQALLIYRLTGSTLLVGVVNFAQFVGTFALAPWSGTAADRFDRRRLMLVAQSFAVLVTAVLALLAAAARATTPVVIGLALLLGITTAFSVPAMQALVPLLVPEHELAGAVALNSVTFNLARAVGPVLGALVVEHFGIATAFGLNALSYVALIVALLVVRPREQVRSARPAGRVKLRDSFGTVLADRRIRLLLLAVVALSLTADPVNTLTPGFVTKLFGQRDTLVGVLVGAFGAGAVAAAFLGGGRSGSAAGTGAGADAVAAAAAAVDRRLALTLGVLGVGMAAFAVAPGFAFAVPALLVGGFGFLAANTTATTAIQLGVSDEQRGRVMALWSVAFLGVRPFGSLIDGAVASAVGLRPAALLMAVPAAATAVVFFRRPRRAVAGQAGT
jgi:MFS family permease